MEKEHQETLKKKIQILFQLGKWPDVIRLCNAYSEKFGREAEIDAIRFKCERHLGVQTPAPETEKGAQKKEDAPITLPAETIADAEPEPRLVDDGEPDFAVSPHEDVVIGDPFADDEPGLRLAPEESPLAFPEDESAAAGFDAPGSIKEGRDMPMSEPPGGESESDFANSVNLTIDAEPELISVAATRLPVSPAGKEAKATPDVAKPAEKKPAAAPLTGKEKILFDGTMYEPPPEEAPPAKKEPAIAIKETAPRGKRFNVKLAMLIVLPLLAAAVLWLALSGKLNLDGNEPQPAAAAAAERPAPRRSRQVKPAAPQPAAAQPLAVTQPAEQEKTFAEKLKQAEELNAKGDLDNAWAAILEAKKINTTEVLSRLEEEVARKLREAAAPKNEWEKETEALARAEKVDTIAGWRDFLRAYPQSESVPQAEARLAALEKGALEEAERQQLLRIQQARKITLRATCLSLSQAEISALEHQVSRPPVQFEAHRHGNATVMLDLAAGLMWSLYDKPMAYDKARWWANRVSAGYGGWRLPTVEEALSLRHADRGSYAGLADFAVWTGDGVSGQSRSAWAMQLPAGRFVVMDYDQAAYVWAVRSVVK